MPLNRRQIAWRAAQDLADGAYVNLGIGLPTMVADFIPDDREIVLHSENGILGVGPAPGDNEIDGRMYVLEKPLKGDVALLSADRGDRWGNLTYRKSARNFNPTMAMAADLSVVQVRRIVELGELDPEMIVTPGIFIDRLVEVPV